MAQGSFSFQVQTPEELLSTLKEDFAELQALGKEIQERLGSSMSSGDALPNL